MSHRRLAARWWLALACVSVGVWLLGIGVVYTDLLAIALALVTITFGVAGVRR